MVERLRAYEEVRALYDKTEMASQQTRAKIKDEAGSWEFHVVPRCTSASCYMSPPSRRYALLLKTLLAPRCFQLPTGVPFVGVLVIRVLLNSTGPYCPNPNNGLLRPCAQGPSRPKMLGFWGFCSIKLSECEQLCMSTCRLN